MRRHLKDKEIAIKKKLEQYQQTRELHRHARARHGLPTVGIVGYTNAGKSRLMHALTSKDILVENKLFATLGTAVGKMYIPPEDETQPVGTEILVNDTIGFIRDLPPELIDAFSSTLEDSIHSDLLLHVVDASDEYIDEKIAVVDEILEKIGAKQSKLYVFNKIDLISEEKQASLREKFADLAPLFISAQE